MHIDLHITANDIEHVHDSVVACSMVGWRDLEASGNNSKAAFLKRASMHGAFVLLIPLCQVLKNIALCDEQDLHLHLHL